MVLAIAEEYETWKKTLTLPSFHFAEEACICANEARPLFSIMVLSGFLGRGRQFQHICRGRDVPALNELQTAEILYGCSISVVTGSVQPTLYLHFNYDLSPASLGFYLVAVPKGLVHNLSSSLLSICLQSRMNSFRQSEQACWLLLYEAKILFCNYSGSW